MKRKLMNMIDLPAVPLAALAMWALGGAGLCLAQQSGQPTFPSAAEASQTLFEAVQSNNVEAITRVLGGPTELTASGNQAQDRVDRELFVQKYQEMHRVGKEPDGSMTLYLGPQNWPFPVPIVTKNGAWRFDPDTGMKEVLYRRIGENELTAIMVCHELVAAEKNVRANQKAASEEDSRLDSLVSAAASGSASSEPVPFHGYNFRVVTKPGAGGKTAGAFGFVAYPGEYRSTGVMTFIVTDNDVVKEKDLGAKTPAQAGALSLSYNATGWVQSDK
jgi:hypothetical protein